MHFPLLLYWKTRILENCEDSYKVPRNGTFYQDQSKLFAKDETNL